MPSLIPVELMQWLPAGLAFLSLFVLNPARAAGGLACDMPSDLLTPAEKLPHVAAALAKGNVDIFALGSGSTVGDTSGAGGPQLAFHAPDASFPHRMTEALQALRPGVHFAITVQGGRNMTAEAMLPLLRQGLAAHHYDLVLWQTATVEAVHGLRTEGLREVLQDGVDEVAAAGADLVLIDPQFSRFLRANTDVSPYETVLQQVSGSPGVTLFPRFDLTQLWVGNGQIDLERVSRDQRDKTIELLNTCLGTALARYVLSGADGS
jgi:acyl-CoA thioesterase I